MELSGYTGRPRRHVRRCQAQTSFPSRDIAMEDDDDMGPWGAVLPVHEFNTLMGAFSDAETTHYLSDKLDCVGSLRCGSNYQYINGRGFEAYYYVDPPWRST
jgi:hypothetical protein